MKHTWANSGACEPCQTVQCGCWLAINIKLGMEKRAGFPAFCEAQAVWSQDTFGADSERGPIGPLKHLQKEVIEVLASPADPEEYADLLFLVVDAARRAGFGHDKLMEAAWKKLAVNVARQWGPPTADEPVEHVRDGGAA